MCRRFFLFRISAEIPFEEVDDVSGRGIVCRWGNAGNSCKKSLNRKASDAITFLSNFHFTLWMNGREK